MQLIFAPYKFNPDRKSPCREKECTNNRNVILAHQFFLLYWRLHFDGGLENCIFVGGWPFHPLTTWVRWTLWVCTYTVHWPVWLPKSHDLLHRHAHSKAFQNNICHGQSWLWLDLWSTLVICCTAFGNLDSWLWETWKCYIPKGIKQQQFSQAPESYLLVRITVLQVIKN